MKRTGQKPLTARQLAASVLIRVERDGAFASAVLDAQLDRTVQMQPRDRRLATELVYGSLRCHRYLLDRLAAFAPKGLNKLDLETRVHLTIAAYQLLCLDRVPAFAAVSEAVKVIRSRRGQGLARFANAILRKLAEQIEQQGRPEPTEAIRASVDPWLFDRISRSLGGESRALAMLTAGSNPPPIGLRVRLSTDRHVWQERIKEAAPDAWVSLGRVSPHALQVVAAGKPQRLPGYERGQWIVQEEGSQMVALALGARSGERVLDACAGRGNKTLLLAEQVGPGGQADAADLHPSKLERLAKRANSMKIAVGNTYPVDWSAGVGQVPSNYDRVLIDAPCSGTGTLRRRPELLRRQLESSLEDITRLQLEILTRAATRAKPGGRVVYAVCSVLREEGEDVVERALDQGLPLEPAPFDAAEITSLAGNRTSFRLVPHEHGTDGYFIASFRVRS